MKIFNFKYNNNIIKWKKNLKNLQLEKNQKLAQLNDEFIDYKKISNDKYLNLEISFQMMTKELKLKNKEIEMCKQLQHDLKENIQHENNQLISCTLKLENMTEKCQQQTIHINQLQHQLQAKQDDIEQLKHQQHVKQIEYDKLQHILTQLKSSYKQKVLDSYGLKELLKLALTRNKKDTTKNDGKYTTTSTTSAELSTTSGTSTTRETKNTTRERKCTTTNGKKFKRKNTRKKSRTSATNAKCTRRK